MTPHVSRNLRSTAPGRRERTEQRDPARGTRAAPEASGRQCRLGVDLQRARWPGGGRAEAQPCGRYGPGARSAATASENRNVKATVAPT